MYQTTIMKNKLLFHLFFLFTTAIFAQPLISEISEFEDKFMYINTPLIINEDLIEGIKSNIDGLNSYCCSINQTDYHFFSVYKKEAIQHYFLLEKKVSEINIITWDKNLEDWLSVASFYVYPTIVQPNQCCVIDMYGNCSIFDSSFFPLASSILLSPIQELECDEFSLLAHSEDYLSKSKDHFFLRNFSTNKMFELDFTQIINRGLIPVDFFYRAEIVSDNLMYLGHYEEESRLISIICFKKEIHDDCLTYYKVYNLVTDGNLVNKLNLIGEFSYIGNLLYQFDFKSSTNEKN